jgi:hypothetical protein
MEVFITRLRIEIKDLQDELLFGDDEREAFSDYWGCMSTLSLLRHSFFDFIGRQPTKA